jgi:exonuclease VII large subunit
LVETEQKALATKIDVVFNNNKSKIEDTKWRIDRYKQLIDQINPNKVLERGYAIWRGQALEGSMIEVETSKHIMKAEVKNVRQKIKLLHKKQLSSMRLSLGLIVESLI